MGTLGRAIFTVGKWIRGTGQAMDRLGSTIQGGLRVEEQPSVWLNGSPGAVVNLLPCDHEVTVSRLENILLKKCRERLRTEDLEKSDPSPDLTQSGAMCTRASL